MNDLVKVENGEIVIAEKIIQELQDFYVLKARMEMQEKEVKEALQEAMEANNIKSFTNDELEITYIAETTRTSVDTQRLKDEGLYELYSKPSIVKASVRLKWK